MDDKIIMNTVLTLTKNACDIMMHGAIESNNQKVKKTFSDSLDQFIAMQGEIFTEMENAGLYNIENVPETKLTKARGKYESTL